MKKAFGSIILLFFLNISAQQIAAVDFQKLHAEITPDPLLKEVRGAINLNFLIKTAVDSIYIDAKKMDFSDVRLNTNKARYQQLLKLYQLYLLSKPKQLAQLYE